MPEVKVPESEPSIQKDAASVVDHLFEARLFQDSMTRKDLQAIEDLVAFHYQMYYDRAKRLMEFTAKFERFQGNKFEEVEF